MKIKIVYCPIDQRIPYAIRYLLIEAVYDSGLYGNDLNLREEGKFQISNLISVAP